MYAVSGSRNGFSDSLGRVEYVPLVLEVGGMDINENGRGFLVLVSVDWDSSSGDEERLNQEGIFEGVLRRRCSG